MIDAGFQLYAVAGQSGKAGALNAFGVRPGKRQTGEELCCHAGSPAAVVVAATAARAGGLRFPQLTKQRRVLPYVVKTTVRQDVSGVEPVVDGERACIHVA